MKHMAHRAITIAAALASLALFAAALHGRAQSMAYSYDPSGNLTVVTQAVAAAPTITVQPQTQILSENGDVFFSVVASGPGPFTYQWLSNGVPMAGATGDVLTLTNISLPPNLVSNGSFELPSITAAFQTFSAPTTNSGWTVESGSVDIVRSS